MPNISITIQGTPRLINKLEKLGDKAKNFEPEFRSLGEYLTQYFSGQAFLSEGGVYSKRWPKLSGKYQAVKIKKFPGRQPLEATGEMRNAFASTAGPKQLMIENTSPHFKYHQSALPRTRLPRRVMIGFNSTIKNKARELISQGLERILHGV